MHWCDEAMLFCMAIKVFPYDASFLFCFKMLFLPNPVKNTDTCDRLPAPPPPFKLTHKIITLKKSKPAAGPKTPDQNFEIQKKSAQNYRTLVGVTSETDYEELFSANEKPKKE